MSEYFAIAHTHHALGRCAQLNKTYEINPLINTDYYMF